MTPNSESRDIPSVGTLREAFTFAIAQQMPLLVFSALILDGGVLFRVVLVATIAFWCFILVFMARRRDKPTNVDTLFIKYGIWVLFLIACAFVILLGRYR